MLFNKIKSAPNCTLMYNLGFCKTTPNCTLMYNLGYLDIVHQCTTFVPMCTYMYNLGPYPNCTLVYTFLKNVCIYVQFGYTENKKKNKNRNLNEIKRARTLALYFPFFSLSSKTSKDLLLLLGGIPSSYLKNKAPKIQKQKSVINGEIWNRLKTELFKKPGFRRACNLRRRGGGTRAVIARKDCSGKIKR